jgi:hypothetical protein
MSFLIPSIQFFFGLPRALFCFGIHFNAILCNLPSAILWTWPYHVSWFYSISFIIVSSSTICCLIVTLQEIYVITRHGMHSYKSSLEYPILLGYDCTLLGNWIPTFRTKNIIFNLTSVKTPVLKLRRYWQLTNTGGPVISVMLFVRTNMYSRVSFCDGLFYDDSLLRPVSSRTEHSQLVVHHCRNSSVLSVLSAVLLSWLQFFHPWPPSRKRRKI